MNTQTEINYYIGLEMPSWEFEEPLIKEASALCAGCTVQRSIGYWIEGGDIPATRYTGPLTEEFCFHLRVSVPKVQRSMVLYTLRAAVRQLARKHGTKIDWVHVTTHDVKTEHFQVIPGRIR